MAHPPSVTDTDQRPLPPDHDCTRCGLADSSETVCCSSRGPKPASILLLGEAPGAEEDQLDRPFVGDAGRKLSYCLSRADLPRKSLRIGNVVRCRPPQNRTPSKKEQLACWPYTLAEILRVKPKIIVALGATAWRAILPHHARHKLDKWRGFPERFEFRYTTPKGREFFHGCWVVGAYHPAACLRNWELDDLLIHDLKLAAQYAAGTEVMSVPDTTVHTCETVADVRALAKRLLRRGSAVVDTEATGTDPHSCKLRCIGFCMRSGEAWIIPWMDENGDQFWTREDESTLIRVLTRLFRKLKIVGQGIKFDIQIFRKLLGLIDYHVEFDTMCGAHVLDENKPTNLTFLCQWHLHWQKYDSVIEKYGSGSDLAGAYAAAPSAVLHEYCGYDCDGTFRLWKKFEPEIKKQGLTSPFSIELGLVLPLADVEFRGIHLDRQRLQEAADGYRIALQNTRNSLVKTCKRVFSERSVAAYCKRCGVNEFVPAEFNPNSADQVAPLLLASGAKLTKRTPGKKFATDKLVLSFLALRKDTAGSIARRLRLMRALTKWKSTYFDGNDADKNKNGFLGLIAEHDRVHASYFITAARTGRLSAKDPPLQTVPRVDPATALGYPVKDQVASLVKPRHIFLPDIPGEHVLLEVDYSKVELCCAAWVSGDGVMVPELLPGAARDLHTNMAITTRLMRNPTDEEYRSLVSSITKSERTVAKAANFGVIYGRRAPNIAESNPGSFPFDMPPKKRITRVQKVIDAWLEKYQGIALWLEEQIETIRRTGCLRDWLGRRRLLTGMQWFDSRWAEGCSHTEQDRAHMENQARNFGIQALATGLHNRATRKCYEGIKQVKIPAFRIVMTLHDALFFNVHRNYIDDAIHNIKGWMELTLPAQKSEGRPYEMPLTVDAVPCDYWGHHDS